MSVDTRTFEERRSSTEEHSGSGKPLRSRYFAKSVKEITYVILTSETLISTKWIAVIIANMAASLDAEAWSADQGWETKAKNKVLDLSDRRLNAEEWEPRLRSIRKAFKSGMCLSKLILDNNPLQEHVTHLIKAVKGGATLSHLSLRNTGLLGPDVENLGKALLNSPRHLEILDLGMNLQLSEYMEEEEEEDALQLAAPRRPFKFIGRALRHKDCVLTSLNLAHCNLDAQSVLPVFRALSKRFGPESKDRRRGKRKNRGEGKEQGEFWRLDISNNPLGAAGLKELMDHLRGVRISSLNLSGTQAGPEGAKAIAGLFRLGFRVTDLDLTHNEIDCSGAIALARALKETRQSKVKTLKLVYNRIGDEGAQAWAHALWNGAKVFWLDLSWNRRIGYVGAKALARNVEHTTHVWRRHKVHRFQNTNLENWATISDTPHTPDPKKPGSDQSQSGDGTASQSEGEKGEEKPSPKRTSAGPGGPRPQRRGGPVHGARGGRAQQGQLMTYPPMSIPPCGAHPPPGLPPPGLPPPPTRLSRPAPSRVGIARRITPPHRHNNSSVTRIGPIRKVARGSSSETTPLAKLALTGNRNAFGRLVTSKKKKKREDKKPKGSKKQ